MNGFVCTDDVGMELIRQPPLAEMFVLSPFVWRDDGGYQVLVRAVNHSPIPADKIARIYAGTSDDGLRFDMGDQPVIPPGPDQTDKDGAEDPTVVAHDDDLYVYYTGWNQQQEVANLMLAIGPDVHHLQKQGITLPSTPEHKNTKEATLWQAPDGSWRLFFEYSCDGHSLVGLASGPSLGGPWTVCAPPFGTREGKFDSWHLSTGPMLRNDPRCPVMFYNGANEQALWRIGWIAFDENLTRVIARSDHPLVEPSPVQPPYRDIAFANSLIVHDKDIWLYYSVADMDVRWATVVRSKAIL